MCYCNGVIQVREYIDKDGRSYFARWFKRLDAQNAARVATALFRLEQGNLSNTKAVGGGVHEYRIHAGPGYRIYFGSEGDQILILLCGGSKRSQRKDIGQAQALWAEYKGRKKEKQV